jgi:hypothetical protein
MDVSETKYSSILSIGYVDIRQHLRLEGLVAVNSDLALRAAQWPRLLNRLTALRITAHGQLANPAVVLAAQLQLALEHDSRQPNLRIRYAAQISHLLGAALAKLVPELLDHQAALCCACVLRGRQSKSPVVLGLLQVYQVQCHSTVLHAPLIVLSEDARTVHARAL